MYQTQRLTLPAFQAYNLGSRNYSRIFSGLRTAYFIFTITATVTLAGGPGTLLLNDGSLLGLISYLGLEENGSEDPCYLDAVTLGKITAACGAQFTNGNVRLRSLANGAYNLRETVVIPFANPRSPNPWETAFVERNPNQPSQMFVVPKSTTTAVGNLVSTAGTAAVTNFTVTCYQIADNRVGQPNCVPYFRPKFRQTTQAIASAGTYDIYIPGSLPIRMLTAGASTSIGTVQDVISSYRLLTDAGSIDGPNQIGFNDMIALQGWAFAGSLSGVAADAASVTPTSGGVLVRDFQESGRLSQMLSPRAQGDNLRFQPIATPSVTAGATATQIIVSVTEMERIRGVTADTIPFNV